MADPHDIARLDSGELDLTHCDFRTADFRGKSLRGRQFGHSDLQDANFESADVSGSNFIRAQAIAVNFKNAKCANTVFGSVAHSKFLKADLQNASFKDSIAVYTTFAGADIRGADFSDASLADADFADATFDDRTDFEGARGHRALGRFPVFKNFEFKDGKYRRKNVSDAQEKADASETLQAGSAPQMSPDLRSAPAEIDARVTVESTVTQSPIPSVESVAERFSRNPKLFAALAADAAAQIRVKISDLESRKPNDPDALVNWSEVTDVLQKVEQQLETISIDLEQAGNTQSAPEKQSRLQRAAETSLAIFDAMNDWAEANAKVVGTVLMQMTLAGTIAGALGYLVGVPPLATFGVAIAGLYGENMWDAIKLFVPSKDQPKK